MNSLILRPGKLATLLTSEYAAHLLGIGDRAIRKNCAAGKYPGATKEEGGWIIPLASLSAIAQTRYSEEQRHTQTPAPLAGLPAVITEAAAAPLDQDALWDAFHRAPVKSQKRAAKLSGALLEYKRLINNGATKGKAAAHIQTVHEIDSVTLWRANEKIKRHPRQLWEAVLLPSYKGRKKEEVLTPAAWDWYATVIYPTPNRPQKRLSRKPAK